MKTLLDLANLVAEREADLAPGSETSILGDFVRDYDHVSSILEGDTELNPNRDESDAFELYAAAYRRLEQFEEDGIDYTENMLWGNEQ